MSIKISNFSIVNAFIVSSILIIFIVSFSQFGFLRAPLLIAHFSVFYFIIIYKNRKIYTNRILFVLFVIFVLTVYVLVQSLVLQSSLITIVQALAMVIFLFLSSQIGLSEGENFYYRLNYKKLSKILLFILPFFLISFGEWSSARKPGLFMNPNITSHLSLMLLPYVLLGLDHKKYRFLAIALAFAIVLITASRSAALALLLGLVAYFFVKKFVNIKFFGLTTLVLGVTLVSMYAVEIAVWLFNFSSSLSNSSSRLFYVGYNGRDVLIDVALNNFSRQPMFGLGFEDSKIVIEGRELSSHNGLIDILLKFGVIGAIIFTLFCLSLVWMISKHNKTFKPIAVMSICLIFSLSTSSSTFFVLNYLFIYAVIIVFLGYKVRNSESIRTPSLS